MPFTCAGRRVARLARSHAPPCPGMARPGPARTALPHPTRAATARTTQIDFRVTSPLRAPRCLRSLHSRNSGMELRFRHPLARRQGVAQLLTAMRSARRTVPTRSRASARTDARPRPRSQARAASDDAKRVCRPSAWQENKKLTRGMDSALARPCAAVARGARHCAPFLYRRMSPCEMVTTCHPRQTCQSGAC